MNAEQARLSMLLGEIRPQGAYIQTIQVFNAQVLAAAMQNRTSLILEVPHEIKERVSKHLLAKGFSLEPGKLDLKDSNDPPPVTILLVSWL